MSKEELQQIENQLIEARRKGLLLERDSTLVARGKVLEMDAFSWQNPSIEVLEKTILSFPFSVLWIGNSGEIDSLIERGNIESKKLTTLIYDTDEVGCDVNWALERCVKLKFKPGILLFTSSNSNSEYNQRKFAEFIQLIQTT
jgi:hypothetical protein